MESLLPYFKQAFGLIFVTNMVLAQFLGLCPFIGVSKKTSSALGMGGAVIFVMTLASVVTYALFRLMLEEGGAWIPADLTFVRIVAFILVIASLVQLVEMAMAKLSPPLYKALGIYLPLITTNCAVMGATELNIKEFGSLPFSTGIAHAAVTGIGGGIGFLLAMVLMSSLRERLDRMPVPSAMRGVPIAFVITTCMALAFLGFAGMV